MLVMQSTEKSPTIMDTLLDYGGSESEDDSDIHVSSNSATASHSDPTFASEIDDRATMNLKFVLDSAHVIGGDLTGADYFNLDVESSSDDDDERTEVTTETSNIDMKIKNPLRVSTACIDEELKKKDARVHTPYEDWTKTTPQINHRKRAHDSLSNLKSCAPFQNRAPHDAGNFAQAQSKRAKFDYVPDIVSRPCYAVHERIKPHLHNSSGPSNRAPKKLICEVGSHAGAVNRIAWCSPQFSHLLLSCSMDATVKVWNAFGAKSSCVRLLGMHGKAVKDAVWSPEGRRVLTGGFDRTARVTDVETGSEICSCEHQDFVSCVKYNPVDPNLFVSGSKSIMLAWDVRSPGCPVRRFTYKDKFGQVQDVCFFAAGHQMLSCNTLASRDSPDRTIMVWDFDSGAVLSNQVYKELYTCSRLCVHPNESSFIAQTQGDYIALFSTTPPYRMNQYKRFEGHKVSGYDIGCDISPDGKIVASGSSDGCLKFYGFNLAKPLCSIKASSRDDVVLNAVWHPVLFSTVATSTWGGRVDLWQ